MKTLLTIVIHQEQLEILTNQLALSWQKENKESSGYILKLCVFVLYGSLAVTSAKLSKRTQAKKMFTLCTLVT